MPFTAAHPLLVLPLRGTRLPMAALVAGSMVPDLPVFARAFAVYAWTHSVPGVLLLDPLLVVVVLMLWFGSVRDAVVDLLPDALRDRLAPRARLPRSAWPWVVPAAVVGAASHVLWDELTHPGRWGTQHVPALAQRYGPLVGASWFQYLSGVVGTLVLAAVLAVWFARRAPLAGARPRRRLPRHTWTTPVVVGVVSGTALAIVQQPEGLHAMAFSGVVGAIVSATAVGAALVLVWHARPSKA